MRCSRQRPMVRPPTTHAGWTLSELLVSLALMAVLAAVALPQFLGVKDKAKINTQIADWTIRSAR